MSQEPLKSNTGQQVHILHYISAFGLGGDARNLSSLALVQSRWAKVSVLTALLQSQERAAKLELQGIDVRSGIARAADLKPWLAAGEPKLCIFHRNGKKTETETALLEEFYRQAVPCFEYNTFARPDLSTDHLWSGHAHLSRASLVQYARRRGVEPLSLSDHRAIGYAVAAQAEISDEEHRQSRLKLGIAEDAFVIVRLQRPDLRKWDPLPAVAISRLISRGVPAHLLVQSAPVVRQRWIKSVCGISRVTLREPTDREDELRVSMAAADCMVNYSVIGETFGLALAEGMVAGLPVVVNSTPAADNAQIEFCIHEETGLVANTVSQLCSSLARLRAEPELGKRLGTQAREFILSRFAPEKVELRLRIFMRDCLARQGHRLANLIADPGAFEDSYCLDKDWLESYRQRERAPDRTNRSSPAALADCLYVKALRLADVLSYLVDIGPAGIRRIVSERLARGTLKRG